MQRFIARIKCVTEYTHIHIYPYAKSKQSNKNKVQQINLVNKGKQNQPRCQLGNKAMETKLTYMLRGKERKKRKKE